MAVTHTGELRYCRWALENRSNYNIKNTDARKFFQIHMADIRKNMLAGQRHADCANCYMQDKNGKISGRQLQLNKIGVNSNQWQSSLRSSPWFEYFKSDITEVRHIPVDWQIYLGNYCNSACIFCHPEASSRLANEWHKLGFINEIPIADWSDDPNNLEQIIDMICSSDQLQYVHLIGGETLILPAFESFLKQLVLKGHPENIILGFTTNLTVWSDKLFNLLTKFKQIHVNISVECFDPLNDYLRWPSRIDQVKSVALQLVDASRTHGWYLVVRTTPTILSLPRLLSVYDWAWQHNTPVESCNFLSWPSHLRMSVLPKSMREPILKSVQAWIDCHNIDNDVATEPTINARHFDRVKLVILQDLQAYLRYLITEPETSESLPTLVEFLKKLEKNRHNSILDYLPDYESLLRANGY